MVASDIPRLFTAIAECSACVLYILLLPRKHSNGKTTAICGGGLVTQAVLLESTGNCPRVLWVPFMLMAIGLMFVLLYLCCDIPLMNVGFWCVRAFLLAEFAASFEWQIYYFWVVRCEGKEPSAFCIQSIALMLLGYSAIFSVAFFLERSSHEVSKSVLSGRELATAIFIGGGAFILSNLSFLQSNTPFSGQSSADILYIRTLVDLVGVAMLYGFHVQRIELMTRYELSVTNTILQNQYDQYRMNRESIALVNRKYHDLKHQIHALRSEADPERRKEWLDEMEHDIYLYEAQNKTGNGVLDTLLTSKSLYCQKHGIKLTCMADASQLGFMKTMDICAIFGNALDNAIESALQLADKQQRLIYVKVGVQQQFLTIRVENYFGGTLEFENGLPVTTKADKEFHGFGVKSIRATAEQYGGTMTARTKNGWFELNLLIPLPAVR